MAATLLGLLLAGVSGAQAFDGGSPERLAERQVRMSATLQQVLTATVAEQPWLPGAMAAGRLSAVRTPLVGGGGS